MASSETRARPKPATIALVLAALLAFAAIAAALLRSGTGGDAPATVSSNTASAQAGTIEAMIARLESRLRQNPDNAADWRMLGWTFFELAAQASSNEATQRAMAQSAAAYRRAAELEPGNAENWSSLGEVLQITSREVSPEAEQAFARALRLNPRDPRARYFAAVQRDLRGEHAAAVEDWLALLRDTPAGAPWEADLRRTIRQAAAQHRIDLAGRLPDAAPAPAPSAATAAIPGPTAEQLAAASAIPPRQQNEMGRQMADRLAARLRQNPRDEARWIMLMRSRMVLNDPRAATEALRSGLAAYRDDAATQARLRQAARELGVPAG